MDTKKHKKDVELTTRYLNELAVHGVTTVAMDMALNDYKAKDLREKLVRQAFELELSERVAEMQAQTPIVEEPELDIPINAVGTARAGLTFEPEFIPKDWPSPPDTSDTIVIIHPRWLQPWQQEKCLRPRAALLINDHQEHWAALRALLCYCIDDFIDRVRQRVKSWHMMWQYWR